MPPTTENGIKRSPTLDILCTQGERYGDGMWTDCIQL